MRIIINTTNLVIGGGPQVAVSFINELRNIDGHEFYIFLSPIVAAQINEEEFPVFFTFYHFPRSPVQLSTRRKILRQLDLLENDIKPDVVFSIFGPSYWRPRAPHLMGFALGLAINEDNIFFKKIPFWRRYAVFLSNRLRMFFVLRDATAYVAETVVVRERLSSTASIPGNKIAVVGNTYNGVFDKPAPSSFPLPPPSGREFRLVSIASAYPHKNLAIMEKVIEIISNKDKSRSYRFFLTINQEKFEQMFDARGPWLVNLGPVSIQDCPAIYEACDVLLLPTLLESFTASYPEAMKMERPILTSNMDFAHDICGDAAMYFDPLNPEEIADAILRVANDRDLYQGLVRLGKERLRVFLTPAQRTEKYLELCCDLARNAGSIDWT